MLTCSRLRQVFEVLYRKSYLVDCTFVQSIDVAFNVFARRKTEDCISEKIFEYAQRPSMRLCYGSVLGCSVSQSWDGVVYLIQK